MTKSQERMAIHFNLPVLRKRIWRILKVNLSLGKKIKSNQDVLRNYEISANTTQNNRIKMMNVLSTLKWSK